jgi:hypothetical protein
MHLITQALGVCAATFLWFAKLLVSSLLCQNHSWQSFSVQDGNQGVQQLMGRRFRTDQSYGDSHHSHHSKLKTSSQGLRFRDDLSNFWALKLWNPQFPTVSGSFHLSNLQDQGTQCDSSSSFKCSQVCNGGDADGYCCDSDSITYIKGTAYKCSDGLEACCGGTDSTTYCQKV